MSIDPVPLSAIEFSNDEGAFFRGVRSQHPFQKQGPPPVNNVSGNYS